MNLDHAIQDTNRETLVSISLIGIASFLLLVVSLFLLHWNTSLVGSDRLYEANMAYLSGIEEQAQKNIIELAEAQSVLNVLQSSDVGISFIVKFQVGIGKELATLTNLIDRAILGNLFEASLAYFSSMLLMLSDAISPILLIALLAAISYACFSRLFIPIHFKYSKLGHKALQLTLTLFLTLHILLPYSIHTAAMISNQLTHDLKQLSGHSLTISKLSNSGQEKLEDKAKHAIKMLEEDTSKLADKTSNLINHIIRHMIIVIFERIIFPCLMFYFFWLILRRVLETIQISKTE